MAIATIVINSKTYTPVSFQNGVLTYEETSGGIPTGFSQLTAQLRRPDREGGAYRLDLRLTVPVVAAEDTDCVCAGGLLRKEIHRSLTEIPNNGTTAERTDVQVRIKDLYANASIIAMLKDLTMPA